MPSLKQQPQRQSRTYDRYASVIFLKTHEEFGGFSNMAGGFPLFVNNVEILTSEALYQACRFPHLPEIQRLIIEQRSPMTAKMKSKPYRQQSRPDWESVQVMVMRWCLRVKLAQNWETFSSLLLKTGDRPIVEESHKDNLWGAKPIDENTLVGVNMLGRLLMELREVIKNKRREEMLHVEPLNIPKFLLAGRPIEVVTNQDIEQELVVPSIAKPTQKHVAQIAQQQLSLFEGLESRKVNSTSFKVHGLNNGGVSDLKSYPKYKESNIPWLGQVPEHWEVRRLRASIMDCVNGVWGADPNGEDDLICVRVADFDRIGLRVSLRNKTVRAIPRSARSRRVLRRGDLLLEKSGGGDLQSVGAVVVYDHDEPAVCSNFVARMSLADGYDPFFVNYLHFMLYANRVNIRSIKQTTGIQNLDSKAYLSEVVAYPPHDEQASSVRFLDWMNGRLERAIRAKRKVIALLGEQKQAIIHRAVTRGLDPSVPLKPSGIPWLGDIPRHWEVRKLKFEMSFRGGGTPSKVNPAYWNGTIPWVSPKDMKLDVIHDAEDHITERAVAESSTNLVPAGSLLMVVRSGILQRSIPVARSSREVAINQDIKALTSKGRLNLEYFVLFIRGCEKFLLQVWTKQGATVESVEQAYLANSKVPIPPLQEQKLIVEWLNFETAPLVSAISRLEREIDLLREYRTRLVADVVTGKLDVREAAARLPDEPLAPEPEPEETSEPEIEETEA